MADSPDLDDEVKEERPPSRASQKPSTPVPVKQWHCKHCGVPETLAGVKMKDVNGQLDLCAKCGNHLQRTGRKRNVEYNEDEEYHRLLDSGPNSGATSPSAFDVPAPSPTKRQVDESDSSSSGSDSDSDDYDDAASRKRKRAKLAAAKAAAAKPKKETPVPATPATPATAHQGLPSDGPQPPAWARQALINMNAKYPGSRFVIIMKARPADQPQGEPQWRVKCPDCPGKIYTLGPGETLDNFEAHAKYRTHTANVQQRIATHGS